MSASGTPGTTTGALGIKQWNQYVPPGWKPHSYPLREYKNYLSLWAAVTSLEERKIGPAIASRLDGSALQIAIELTVSRTDVHGVTQDLRGADALSLLSQDAVVDPGTGAVLVPRQEAGSWHLIRFDGVRSHPIS